MRPIRLLAACTAALYLALPAVAWNATGHRIVAAIAYDRLTPKARARVDDLLKRHPDYPKLFAGDARVTFIAAAVWPDDIRDDPRFYDDLSPRAQPTPLLPGFPDMARHTNWHYINLPYTPDGAHPEKQAPPNVLSELKRILRQIDRPYDLPWLEHLVGDVHQPLHSISRTLKSQPQGDAGGNRVFVSPGRNLHFFWDDLPGSDTSDGYVTKFAADVTAQHAAPHDLDKNPQKWLEEGFRIARSDVYTFGLETGTSQNPIRLTETYQENAKRVAYARISLAGYRLAAVLNDRLK